MKATRHVLAVGAALCALLVCDALTPVRAQNGSTAVDQYLASVMLTQDDAPGYLRDSAGPSDVVSNQVAGRRAAFSGTDQARVSFFIEWVALLPNDQAAQNLVAAIRNNVSRTSDNLTIVYTWDSSVAGFDQAERYRWVGRSSDGSRLFGVGIGFRRGPLYFEILAASLDAPGALAVARDEVLRLANIQNAKAIRLGAYTPPVAPAQPTPASTGGSPEQLSDIIMLGSVWDGPSLARAGTPVRALINGKECGSDTILNGLVAMIIASRDTTAGCGVPGAVVTFEIDGRPARETLVWNQDKLANLLKLTLAGTNSGSTATRVIVPLLDLECLPAPDGTPCSEEERRLWDGDIAAWTTYLLQRSEQAGARAYFEFRAARGELLSKMVLASQDEQPFTFIASIVHTPSDDEPEPYVSLFTVGAPQPAGGWTVVTDTGATYTFPAGTVLPVGECRIFAHPDVAGPSANTCPGAALSGADPVLEATGFVYLRDENGQGIAGSTVSW